MPESGSVKVTGALFWARTDGTTASWGVSHGGIVAGSTWTGTYTLPPPPGHQQSERKISYWAADTGSPRLYRHANTRSCRNRGHASFLINPTAGSPPFPGYHSTGGPRKLRHASNLGRTRQMKGQGQQKPPVGGSGGNPVRHGERDATPAMHPGNRHVPPTGEDGGGDHAPGSS